MPKHHSISAFPRLQSTKILDQVRGACSVRAALVGSGEPFGRKKKLVISNGSL
jgi:hypothetical protein